MLPSATTVDQMSVASLRAIIEQAGLDHAGLLDKAELKSRACEALLIVSHASEERCEDPEERAACLPNACTAHPRPSLSWWRRLLGARPWPTRRSWSEVSQKESDRAELHNNHYGAPLHQQRARECLHAQQRTIALTCLAGGAITMVVAILQLLPPPLPSAPPPTPPPLPPFAPSPLAPPSAPPPSLHVHVHAHEPPEPPPPPLPSPLSPPPPPPRLPPFAPPLHPPPPPVAPGVLRSVADVINERFMQGHPSNSMAEAGVFISQIDVMHHPTKPWLPCPLDDRTVWCWWLGDRIPGSVISRQQVDLARERKCMRAARTVARATLRRRPSNSRRQKQLSARAILEAPPHYRLHQHRPIVDPIDNHAAKTPRHEHKPHRLHCCLPLLTSRALDLALRHAPRRPSSL